MLMIDVCSGLGGASGAMKQRGWKVVTLDINPAFKPDIVADAKHWSWAGERPDLIWASPVCTEFAKFGMKCWYKDPPPPDMSLMLACKRIIDKAKPRYWIIENVRGAIPFFTPILGRPRMYRPYFLWGYFPPIGNVHRERFTPKTKKLSSSNKAARAKIPDSLSKAIAIAIESQLTLDSVGGVYE